jgi:hypothetical protein
VRGWSLYKATDLRFLSLRRDGDACHLRGCWLHSSGMGVILFQ